MDASINKDGVLVILAETELEAFAIKAWSDMNSEKINSSKLMLNANLEKKEPE